MPFRSIAASPWPEADRAFRQDPRWLGSDGIGSVTIGDANIWLFGDTFVGGPNPTDRTGASMISNSVAVQHGAALAHDSLEFHWRNGPAAVFERPGEPGWLWPGGTLFTDNTLYVFCMKVVTTRPELSMLEAWEAEGSLGFFEVVGTSLAVVADPQQPPSSWDPDYFDLRAPDGYFVGSANVYDKGLVYSFGWRGLPTRREAILARWSLAESFSGKVEWFEGSGWTSDPLDAASLFEGVATEYTIHRAVDFAGLLDDAGPAMSFVHLQAGPIGTNRLELRAAPELWGPWTEPLAVDNPAAPTAPGTFAYTARAHPQVRTNGVAVSFCTIGSGAQQTIESEELYYPRFLRLSTI